MSLAVRVCARLDIKPSIGVVKGRRMDGLHRVGDPLELAQRYEAQGADEILYLDTTASLYGRLVDTDLIRRTNDVLSTPMTVGGGVRSLEDFAAIIRGGAEKVAMNTAALARPELIRECAEAFGSQAVVISLEVKRGLHHPDVSFMSRGYRRPSGADASATRDILRAPRMREAEWTAYCLGGREPSGRDAVEWSQEAVARGAGELLVTSVDRDGTRSGFDTELIRALRAELPGTVIVASGGCGTPEDVLRGLEAGASAVAVGTYLHEGGTVGAIKQCMADHGIEVRV